MIAERQGLASADAAPAKIRRVLPDRLRRRVEALEAALGLTMPAATGAGVAGNDVLLLAEAIRRRRRVHARYGSFGGEVSDRELSAHGLVAHSGRWYVAAYDHRRRGLRTFRVDRMAQIRVGDEEAVAPPDGFDPVTHVASSLAQVPRPWKVDVVLALPIEQAAPRLPRTLAELQSEGDRTRVHMRVESLDWTAALLSGLDCDFAIVEPDELRASVRALARRLERIAKRRSERSWCSTR